jgi:hypothetical protein
MEKKIRIELTNEELNELYYVLGMADLNRNLGMAKYELIENMIEKIGKILNDKK